jgi:hypothetical protein
MTNKATIGGEVVNLYCEDVLSTLRTQDGVVESLFQTNEFDFSTLADGGAKGGSKMQFTKNKRFFVKQLSDEDHSRLLSLSKTYVDYIKSNKDSLLIRFYYHFRRDADSQVSDQQRICHNVFVIPDQMTYSICRTML